MAKIKSNSSSGDGGIQQQAKQTHFKLSDLASATNNEVDNNQDQDAIKSLSAKWRLLDADQREANTLTTSSSSNGNGCDVDASKDQNQHSQSQADNNNHKRSRSSATLMSADCDNCLSNNYHNRRVSSSAATIGQAAARAAPRSSVLKREHEIGANRAGNSAIVGGSVGGVGGSGGAHNHTNGKWWRSCWNGNQLDGELLYETVKARQERRLALTYNLQASSTTIDTSDQLKEQQQQQQQQQLTPTETISCNSTQDKSPACLVGSHNQLKALPTARAIGRGEYVYAVPRLSLQQASHELGGAIEQPEVVNQNQGNSGDLVSSTNSSGSPKSSSTLATRQPPINDYKGRHDDERFIDESGNDDDDKEEEQEDPLSDPLYASVLGTSKQLQAIAQVHNQHHHQHHHQQQQQQSNQQAILKCRALNQQRNRKVHSDASASPIRLIVNNDHYASVLKLKQRHRAPTTIKSIDGGGGGGGGQQLEARQEDNKSHKPQERNKFGLKLELEPELELGLQANQSDSEQESSRRIRTLVESCLEVQRATTTQSGHLLLLQSTASARQDARQDCHEKIAAEAGAAVASSGQDALLHQENDRKREQDNERTMQIYCGNENDNNDNDDEDRLARSSSGSPSSPPSRVPPTSMLSLDYQHKV